MAARKPQSSRRRGWQGTLPEEQSLLDAMAEEGRNDREQHGVQWFPVYRYSLLRGLAPPLSWLSALSFSWFTPVINAGARTTLKLSDTLAVPAELNCSHLYHELLQGQKSASGTLDVRKALIRLAGYEFVAGGVCRFFADVCALLLTYVLRKLMLAMQNTDSSTHLQDTISALILLMVVSMLQSAFLQIFIHAVFMAGARVSTAATTLVMNASLRLKLHSKHSDWEGRVSNILAKDAQSLREFVVFAHNLWAAPITVVGSVCLLAAVVGPAAVVGVCGILVFIPIENRVNKWSKALRKGSLKLSDTRMAHVYDLLDGIRTVKLANLTGALESRITALRDAELKQDALVTSLNVFNRALMSSAPALVAVITFTLYFFLERAGSDSSAWWSVPPLTADRAFTAIALLGQLSHPFKVMPKAIQLLADANVSVGRIQGMVDETEASCAGSDEHPEILEGAPKVELENFSVSRSPVGDSFSLRNISAHFERGLNMVIGTNASGKSTLLMGIMSELKIITGSVRLKPSETGIAFASSDATWVINATAKENIVLGSRSSLVDEMRYQEAVHACALDRDFSEWVDGDQTMIGEKGITLSGGQRARICIARAMYSQCSVVLLDTPLASVDSVVGQHVFQNAIRSMSRTSCVIMVTHNKQYVPFADQVFYMKDGAIAFSGSYERLPAQVLNSMGATADDSMLPAKSQSNSTGPAGGTGNEKNPQNIDQQSLTTRKQQQEDDRVWVQGSKNANVVRAYLASCGWGLVALTLMLTVCSHALGAWKESILAGWSTTQPGNASGYLWLYVGASLVVILSNFLKMYGSMWAGLAASKSLHQRLLSAILGAPLQFFDTTPSGRIANRFSADIDAIDFTLPEGLMAMLESVLMMVTGVGVVVASTPMFLLFLAPLMYFYIQFQQLYRRTSTELKILDSSTKSPIFSQYREALDGLDTIRGYRIQDVVILKHNRLMDDQQRARLNWDAANRWLGVRLDVIGTLLISSAALVVIIGVQSGQIQPGYAGYALAFALGATKGFGFTVRSLTALENTFVACDRVLQYTRLRQEDTQLPSLTDPEALPEREPLLHATEESLELGEIPREEALIVRDLVVSYGLDLPNALDGVSITVSRGTTLGICGRTGCGKSTLSLSLARGVEALRGEILVNGVDVSKMNLRDLRARVQVFPQDSYVFAGTVEEVIDPWKKASAATLQRIANELLQLFVQETPKVLQTSELTSTQALLQFQIDKGGTNISAGQRQLLSLARAVISEAHVVVLDECCSQMDPSISHLALRFVKSTLTRRGAAVLLIAHRLDDIADCDRVIVMERGRIEESGSPQELLRDARGQFTSLVANLGRDAQQRIRTIAAGSVTQPSK